jgi:hypothetical protein
VVLGKSEEIAAGAAIHRVGGGAVANLRLSPLDRQEDPPGISVLLGGAPQEAAEQMRQAFPKSRKWQQSSHTVGTATAAAIRAAGFDILPDPTARFPNHGRLIHPDGLAGFTDENLKRLSQAFQDTTGC